MPNADDAAAVGERASSVSVCVATASSEGLPKTARQITSTEAPSLTKKTSTCPMKEGGLGYKALGGQG